MLDKSKNYLIVGLGLLGGRYAQVLSQKAVTRTGMPQRVRLSDRIYAWVESFSCCWF